jgi:hypothetical protein
VRLETLKAFGEALNRRDLDAVTSYFAGTRATKRLPDLSSKGAASTAATRSGLASREGSRCEAREVTEERLVVLRNLGVSPSREST